jgi:hypothetical protein
MEANDILHLQYFVDDEFILRRRIDATASPYGLSA